MFKAICKRAVLTLGATSGLFFAQAGQAAPGLLGSWYDTGPISTLQQAANVIQNQTPDATFISTTVCFPSCHSSAGDNMTLNAFLGSNATDISANSITNLSGHVMWLTGFIDVATTGWHSLGVGSDDGSALLLDGGDIILLNDGLHAYEWKVQNYWLTAGLHQIDIVQFENGGNTGLTAKLDYVPITGEHFPPVDTGAVPEPASWAMMILGLALVGRAMRTRRTQLSFA